MMPADSTLHFEKILWLWALLFLVPLAALFVYAQKKREELLSKLIALRLRDSLVGHVSMVKRLLRSLLLLVALGLLFLALAKPRLGYEEHSVPSFGRDIMIAIDTSRSMLATDVTPTRLARAKLLAQDVLDLLPGDRIGLIAFSGKAFLQAPMTLDHSAIRDSINELDTNIIPKGGTNIAEAIELTIAALGKGEGTERALILMTDGEDLQGASLNAAKAAKEASIKIFTIGIGSPQGSLLPIVNPQNKNDFVRDEEGKPVLSKLDLVRLQEIASVTGGFYEPYGADAAKNIVQKAILPLSHENQKKETIRRPIERYEWPLAAALLLLVLWWILNEKRRLPCVVVAFGILVFFPQGGQATPGLSEYNQGNYKAALATFEQQLKQGNTSDAARFDAGAAAYKQGEYQKAIDYFTGAMTSSSPKIQQAATYNLANALVREGERIDETDKKLSEWKSAIEHYDTVLKVDPKNKQAKENQALVRKMIEDLKKQEEQKKKDSKQDQDQQKKDQQKSPPQDQEKNSSNTGQGSSSQDQQKNNQDTQKSGSKENNPSSQDQHKSGDSQQSSSQNEPSPSPAGPAKSEKEDSSSESQQEKKSMPSSDQKQQGQRPGETSSTNGPQQTPRQDSQNMNQNRSPQGVSGDSANLSNSASKSEGTQGFAPEKKEGALSGGEEKAPAPTAMEEGEGGMISKAQAEAVLQSMKDEEEQVRFQHPQASEETTKDW
jgi:Ca-activated chloride channel family protein